jgi:hypothetical protein
MKTLRLQKVQAVEKPTYTDWIKHLKDYQVKIGNIIIHKL